MAEYSQISWTDSTVNFWWGCSRVSLGCDDCYADTWAQRWGFSLWGPGVPRKRITGAVALIRKLQRTAAAWFAKYRRARRVFIQSMSDLFDNEIEIAWLREAWAEIKAADLLEIQIVTKRISLVKKRLAAIGETAWPKHVGLLISVVNQAEAERDIPRLIELKKALGIPWVGLSLEPLLGPITLRPEWLAQLDWVIVGGESGAKARPMHPDWLVSLYQQCEAAGVPFLFKQWGEWETGFQRSDGTPVFRQFDTHEQWVAKAASWVNGGTCLDRNGKQLQRGADMAEARDAGNFPVTIMHKVGKKKAGRLLDGREHNGFPEVTP